MSESNTRAEIVEVMARGMLARSGIRFLPEHDTTKEAMKLAEAALIALESSGRAVVPGWQPIATAPLGDVIRYEPACYRKNESKPHLPARIVISNGAYPRQASHWMPLPLPPSKE